MKTTGQEKKGTGGKGSVVRLKFPVEIPRKTVISKRKLRFPAHQISW